MGCKFKKFYGTWCTKFYGSLGETKFFNLEKRERNFLTLYGIDEGKWDMLRSIKSLALIIKNI